MQTEFSELDVTVVSVCFNSTAVLPDMLGSLPNGVKVVLVDNASSDIEELATIAENTGARLIQHRNNLGFGTACNSGAAQAKTEFLLFLNPDAKLEQGTVKALLAAATRHPDSTAFSPKMTDGAGRPYFKHRSVLLPKKQWLKRGWPDLECEIPVMSGAAIFLRRRVFDRLAFDPKIFLYHEDDDWSLRMRAAGNKLIFVPDAMVTHAQGRSTQRSPEVAQFKAFHLGQSRIIAMKKHGLGWIRSRSTLLALAQFLNPVNLFSERKRAKQRGFLRGVTDSRKKFQNIRDLPDYSIIPFWKLRREITRTGRQIASVPRGLSNYFLETLWYDLVIARQKCIHPGDLPAGDKIAIFLVFAKGGLLPSHRRTLEAIIEAGFTPLVISNLPLSSGDIEYLKTTSWVTIERPNIGYDFGGYRDGVLFLKKEIPGLQHLVLINDSSWYPVPDTSDWFKDALASGADFVGAATSFGIMRVSRDRYQAIEWKYDVNLKDFHYCSYALMIGPKILADPRFLTFWKRFKLSDDKKRVVRRGEMGLSQWVIRNGYSHSSTYDIQTLPDDLKKVSDEVINQTARALVFLGDAKMDEVLENVLPKLDATRSLDERNELELLILANVARFGVSYVIPAFLHDYRGFPFLKKSPVSLHRGNSDIMFEIAKSLRGEDGRIIEKEMRSIRRNKFSID